MLSPNLLETLEKLLPALQTEILHYAEFLANKYLPIDSTEQSPKQYRQAGSMKGMFSLSDDFDEPLEELKDYTLP